jgi:hypothetical protein
MPIFSHGPIIYKKIIAVEGPDDDNFFDALLRRMNIKDYDIRFVGGKDEFKNKLSALKNVSGFFNANGSPFVTHLAIIRDGNDDNAFESVTNIIKKEGFTPPKKHALFSNGNPKIGIFIMPGTTVKGTMLEDLCLKTVEKNPEMKCVNEFASCVSAMEPKPKNMSKAKAQTFLAAQPEIANSVGVGAQKGYWNFESTVLEELKQFLNNFK